MRGERRPLQTDDDSYIFNVIQTDLGLDLTLAAQP
jgi:hypothetical protein